ncbi:MAG TPA: DUF3617 family protein [Acidobacteriaceae bacterium]|nr:DUF3617 family protein [Acidobacteriaceae bacterium]
MTISELVFLSALLLPSAIQTQNGKAPVTPPPASGIVAAPPIKMGLWEATITNSLISKTLKTRSCVTPQSYQDAMTRVPPGCTIANKMQTPTSISGDLSCTLQHGGTTTGHIDVEMPDPTTMTSTVQLNVTAGGQTTPMKLTTESHFVAADCGDLGPGQSKMVQ